MWVPGSRPNRRMDIVHRRSHHSPRSCIFVSPIFLDYLWSSAVVTRNIVPWQVITAQRNARLTAHTPSSLPSSLMVVLVGSSVPILYQNLACPPRYPLWEKANAVDAESNRGSSPHLASTAGPGSPPHIHTYNIRTLYLVWIRSMGHWCLFIWELRWFCVVYLIGISVVPPFIRIRAVYPVELCPFWKNPACSQVSTTLFVNTRHGYEQYFQTRECLGSKHRE